MTIKRDNSNDVIQVYYKLSRTSKTATTQILNVRLPTQVLSMLDQLVEKKLFASRSEAIREFCREYVNNNKRGRR